MGESTFRAAQTPQSAVWNGDFGREYTDRNTFDTEGLNKLYLKNYGVSRTEINRQCLQGIPKTATFLEVGCNTGNQLLLLHEMGYANVSGVELQSYALQIARRRLTSARLELGSVFAIPFADASFDVVFTSGVLIHIAPHDLPMAMAEIYRCSKSYIWGFEYFAPEPTEVRYRGHEALLWKMDYARCYCQQFRDLKLVQQNRLSYTENTSVDMAFLLRKAAL